MKPPQTEPWWMSCRWTLGLVAAMAVLNLGLFPNAPEAFARLIADLQFDRQAILAGQLWRLATGNLVHWSVEHFFLDVGAFLVVGLLYERRLPRSYAWILLASGVAVGCSLLIFQPEMCIYRGLSGVDSGQFVAALGVEFWLARRHPARWIWVAPAAAVFAAKILYECTSGQTFFGTESLGNIGLPIPLAHAAGVLGAGICLALGLAPVRFFGWYSRTTGSTLPGTAG